MSNIKRIRHVPFILEDVGNVRREVTLNYDPTRSIRWACPEVQSCHHALLPFRPERDRLLDDATPVLIRVKVVKNVYSSI